MAKALSITVADAIALLKERIAEGEAHEQDHKEIVERNNAKRDAYELACLKAAIKFVKAHASTDNVSESSRGYFSASGKCKPYVLEVPLSELPTQPVYESSKFRALQSWEKQQLLSTIKLLQMHTEPTVSMGTLNKVKDLI